MLLHLAGAFYLQEDSMAAASLMPGMADLVKGHPVVVSCFSPTPLKKFTSPHFPSQRCHFICKM